MAIPLGLSLLVDVWSAAARRRATRSPRIWWERCCDDSSRSSPAGRNRRALEVCAVARVTTEALLRDVLEVETRTSCSPGCGACPSWNRGRRVVPHDLARDALEADLRWRDPDGYRQVFRRIRGTSTLAADSGGQSNSARSPTPSTCSADCPAWCRRWTGAPGASNTPSRPAGRPAGDPGPGPTWEGEESAAIAERWWEQQPEGFFVVRDQDGAPGGFSPCWI